MYDLDAINPALSTNVRAVRTVKVREGLQTDEAAERDANLCDVGGVRLLDSSELARTGGPPATVSLDVHGSQVHQVRCHPPQAVTLIWISPSLSQCAMLLLPPQSAKTGAGAGSL